MSELFIKTIIQHGGDLSEPDKVAILNIAAKKINKKMKIMEYKYGIQLKLSRLPESNNDCLPKKIGIYGMAQIDGPFRGQIPYYTNTKISIPTPTISTVSTGIPLSPFGPVIGVPSLAINPFGNSNKLEDRIKKANETLEKLIELGNKLGSGTRIEDLDPLKKYFDYIDLEEPDFTEEIEKILNKKKL
jgi:hypothetical protein